MFRIDILTNMDAMKNIDIRTVDPAELVDIRDVTIDTSLPQSDKLRDYLRQIKNPYCYKHGKAIIKVKYADTEATLEDQLESFLLSL